MDEPSLAILAVTIGAVLVALLGGVLLFSRAFVKAEQGHALVVSKPGHDEVRFGSSVVLPLVHRAEAIDLRTKTLSIDRRGKQGISCRDGVRADIILTAHLRVGSTADDVLKVAHTVGCARASEPAVLEELFASKLAEAVKTVAGHLDFEHLQREREAFKDEVLAVVGTDLSGYVLDDVVIVELEQTPLELHDPSNIRDAQGIRVITERTMEEQLRKRELDFEAERQRQRQALELAQIGLEAERQLRQQQLELEELVIELERRKADALGRFRETTGRELTPEELRARLEEGLRQVVERVLDERHPRA
jgi:uncharacterized membrane protein YqiK